MIQGSIVALVTPMRSDGSIDFDCVRQLIEWHIENGTNGIVVAGTTGESATLSIEEHSALIEFVVNQVAKRIPVIAGSGASSTRLAVELTAHAKEDGADACLIVTPYYNKPTQQGLFEHFRTIAESVDIPIILYNVPGRTGCDLLPETVEKLTKFANIKGIKDATGKLDRLGQLLKHTTRAFSIYSGDDPTSLEWMLHGAKGVISITSNVAPRAMRLLCDAALAHRHTEAMHLNQKLASLHERLCIESNPIPVKWVLAEMGKIELNLRLPLVPLDKIYHPAVKEAMQIAEIGQTAEIG